MEMDISLGSGRVARLFHDPSPTYGIVLSNLKYIAISTTSELSKNQRITVQYLTGTIHAICLISPREVGV